MIHQRLCLLVKLFRFVGYVSKIHDEEQADEGRLAEEQVDEEQVDEEQVDEEQVDEEQVDEGRLADEEFLQVLPHEVLFQNHHFPQLFHHQ